MSGDDPRKAYWNEKYFEYWKSRVEEAGHGKSVIVEGDSNTEDDSVYQRVFDSHTFRSGSLLEVGCAWGRMFPFYLAYGLRTTGSDISHAMVVAARKEWQEKEGIVDIVESPAERLPFADGSFDNLTCLATLDATYQDRAITEFLRVTRPGARIIFTGKNDHYFQDDKEAYLAEMGARDKKHPNFFTDTKHLIDLLSDQGHYIRALYCFPRRGDFARFRYVTTPNDRFYEFLVVIDRGNEYEALPSISDAYSKTFRELESADE